MADKLEIVNARMKFCRAVEKLGEALTELAVASGDLRSDGDRFVGFWSAPSSSFGELDAFRIGVGDWLFDLKNRWLNSQGKERSNEC